MGIIIPFPILNRKAEEQFITVLKTPEIHVQWNRSQLFYIKECIYPIRQHILTYATVDSRGRAQKIAQFILTNLRNEFKGLAKHDKAKG